MTKAITISALKEQWGFAPALALAHAREWQHLYPDWQAQTALAEFEQQRVADDVTTTLVLHVGDQWLGSISLLWNDLPEEPSLNPWLASLYVKPEQRGQGYGSRLVAALSGWASEREVAVLYLFTEAKMAMFERLGFTRLRHASANQHPVWIMQKRLVG